MTVPRSLIGHKSHDSRHTVWQILTRSLSFIQDKRRCRPIAAVAAAARSRPSASSVRLSPVTLVLVVLLYSYFGAPYMDIVQGFKAHRHNSTVSGPTANILARA